MQLSIVEFITLVLSLVLFAMGFFPLESSLFNNRFRLNSPLLILFGLLCGTFAVVSMLQTVPDVQLSISSVGLHRIGFLTVGALAITYHLLTRQVLIPERRATNIANGLIAVGLIGAAAFLWSRYGISASSDSSDVELGTATYIAGGTWLAITLISIWFSANNPSDSPKAFLIPAILIALVLILWFVSSSSLRVVIVLLLSIALAYLYLGLMQANIESDKSGLQEVQDTNQRERTRIVNELARTQKELESIRLNFQEANQYRTQFLTNMSHELRTPLNSIIGYAELLRDEVYGQLNEKQADRIERIHRNGNHLLELVTDILDLNELDKGKLYLSVEAFQLQSLLEAVIEGHADTCKEKGLECGIEITSELPFVFGDREQLKRLFDNLLDNAIKFTDHGGITVNVTGVHVLGGQTKDFVLPTIGWLPDGDWVVIKVKDTGIGILPEDQARIFDVFTQVDDSRTRTHGGTGIGLTIVKRLAELHGGTVWVKSRAGEGSEFFVALPSDHHNDKVSMTNQGES